MKSPETTARTIQSYLTRAQPQRGLLSLAEMPIDFWQKGRAALNRSALIDLVVCGVRILLGLPLRDIDESDRYIKLFLIKLIRRNVVDFGATFNLLP